MKIKLTESQLKRIVSEETSGISLTEKIIDLSMLIGKVSFRYLYPVYISSIDKEAIIIDAVVTDTNGKKYLFDFATVKHKNGDVEIAILTVREGNKLTDKVIYKGPDFTGYELPENVKEEILNKFNKKPNFLNESEGMSLAEKVIDIVHDIDENSMKIYIFDDYNEAIARVNVGKYHVIFTLLVLGMIGPTGRGVSLQTKNLKIFTKKELIYDGQDFTDFQFSEEFKDHVRAAQNDFRNRDRLKGFGSGRN